MPLGMQMVPRLGMLAVTRSIPASGTFFHEGLVKKIFSVVRALDSGSGDPGSILGLVGVLFP